MTIQKVKSSTTTNVVEANIYQIANFACDMVWLEETVINGVTTAVYIEFDKKKAPVKNVRPKLVKSSFFNFIKKTNPFNSYGEKESHLISAEEIFANECSNHEINLVWIYEDSLIFDVNGTPITRIYSFDYITSIFRSKYCYMRPMLDYLKKHPWVINGEDLEICQVEHYNRENSKDMCFSPSVLIVPDQKTYEEMYELVKTEKYPSSSIKELISGFRYYSSKDKQNTRDWLGIAPFIKEYRKYDF